MGSQSLEAHWEPLEALGSPLGAHNYYWKPLEALWKPLEALWKPLEALWKPLEAPFLEKNLAIFILRDKYYL